MNREGWRSKKVDCSNWEKIEKESHIYFGDSSLDNGKLEIDSRQELLIKHLQNIEEFELSNVWETKEGHIEYVSGSLPLSALRIKSNISSKDRDNILSRILI